MAKYLDYTGLGLLWGKISSNFLRLSGGIMTGAIQRYYNTASTDPTILVGSNNQDAIIWKVYSSDATYSSDVSMYGFSLKYLGTGTGNDNKLVLYSDNQTGTKVPAVSILQDGKVGIGTLSPTYTAHVAGNIYSSTYMNAGTYVRASGGNMYIGSASGSQCRHAGTEGSQYQPDAE